MVAGLSGETKPLLASKASEREHPPEEKHYQSLDFDRLVNEYSASSALARNRHVFQQRVRSHHRSSKSYLDETSFEAQKTKDNAYVHRSSSTLARAENVKLSNRGFVVARWFLTMLVGLCTGLTATFC